MNSTTIQQINSIKQDRQDGIYTMQGITRTRLIHRIIREYGQYDGVNYSVKLSEIDLNDRAEMLYHVLEDYEYRWCLISDKRINKMFDEHEKYIDELIEMECQDVYREDMEEMGMSLQRHSDNNEEYWIRR